MPDKKSLTERFGLLDAPQSSEKKTILKRFEALSFKLPPGVTIAPQKSRGTKVTGQDIGRFTVEQLPGILSTLPFLIPGGQALGATGLLARGAIGAGKMSASAGLSFGGAAAQNRLQTAFPEQLGDPGSISESALTDIGTNVLIGSLLKVPVLAKGTKNFFKTILNPQRAANEASSLIREVAPSIPTGVSKETLGDIGLPFEQEALGDITETIRGELSSEIKRRVTRRTEAFEALRQELPTQVVTRISKGNIPKGLSTSEAASLVREGKATFAGTKEIEVLEGPIALEFVKEELESLQKSITSVQDSSLSPDIAGKFSQAKELVDKLLTPANIEGQGNRLVASFEDVKQLRTFLTERTFGKVTKLPDKFEKDLSATLNKGIKRSFDVMDSSGNLNTLLTEANFATAELGRFSQKQRNLIANVETFGGKDVPGNLQSFIDSSLNSAVGTKRLVAKLGGDPKLAREFFLSKSLTNRINTQGNLDLGGFVIDLIKSRKNKGTASLFSDKQFKALIGFFREAEKQLPFASGKETGALRFSKGLFSAFGTFAAFRSLFRGDVTDALVNIGAGLGTRIALEMTPEMFTKMILSDPSKADIAKGLLTGNPRNKNVIAAWKKLLAGKEVVIGIRVFGKGDDEGQLIAQNFSLNAHKFRPQASIFNRVQGP